MLCRGLPSMAHRTDGLGRPRLVASSGGRCALVRWRLCRRRQFCGLPVAGDAVAHDLTLPRVLRWNWHRICRHAAAWAALWSAGRADAAAAAAHVCQDAVQLDPLHRRLPDHQQLVHALAARQSQRSGHDLLQRLQGGRADARRHLVRLVPDQRAAAALRRGEGAGRHLRPTDQPEASETGGLPCVARMGTAEPPAPAGLLV